jgi:hypothetical protein
MKCVVCEELVGVDEILANEGMCARCKDALKDVPDLPDEAEEEMNDAIQRYLKRRRYMETYNQKPEVKRYRKEYQRKRRERDKKLIEAARKLKLLPPEMEEDPQ